MDIVTETQGINTPDGITRSNIVRVCVVYAAIIADVFVSAYTDPLQTTEVLTNILLLGLQIFLVLVIVLAFFLLTTSLSLHVQLGLYDKYLRQHRGVFTLSLLAVLLVASMGAYRLVRPSGGGSCFSGLGLMAAQKQRGSVGCTHEVLVYQNTPYLEMWQQPGYLAMWIMQRVCLLSLHCTAAYATAMSFKRPKQSWLASAAGRGLLKACRTVW